jgi:hypothetical protein
MIRCLLSEQLVIENVSVIDSIVSKLPVKLWCKKYQNSEILVLRLSILKELFSKFEIQVRWIPTECDPANKLT